ncbi:MAG: PKD domain-containing protein [Rhodothermales bacterium]
MRCSLFFVLLTLYITQFNATAYSRVDEVTFPQMAETFWVDDAGVDAPSCSETQPCKTITYVLESLAGDGDVINVMPGIYREQIDVHQTGISLRGTDAGVFIFGSEKPALSEAEGKYVADWPWAASFAGSTFCGNLTNDVSVDAAFCNTAGFWQNGVRLSQVLSKSAVVAGTFYVDFSAEEVWLLPLADNDNLNEIEGLAHPYVVKLTADSREVTLENLHIWYGASLPDDGILQVEGAGHNLVDLDIRYSAGAGILVYGADQVYMNGVASEQHGQNGWRVRANASFSTTSGWVINDWVDDLQLVGSSSRKNGWKGYDNCWGGGGTKFSFTQDLTIDSFYSADNNGFGIWLDIENHNFIIEESLSAKDTGRGIFVEYISDNGIVENNVVFGTEDADAIGCGISVGLAVADSREVLVKHNTVYSTADDVKGMMLKTGCPTCRSFPYPSESITWENNLLVNKGDAGFVRDLDAGSADGFTYLNTKVEESFAGDATVAVCWDNLGNCSKDALGVASVGPGTYLENESDECGFNISNSVVAGAGVQNFVHPFAEEICGASPPPPAPPVADFSFSLDGLTVLFTDASSGDSEIVDWVWDFGDGNGGIAEAPTHTYESTGTYTVSLTVTDTQGLSDTHSDDVTVQLDEPPQQAPVADFLYETAGLSVTVTDASIDDGTIVSWVWDFGDGSESTLQNTTHTYDEAGTYTMSLMVTDNDGLLDTATKEVVVVADDQPQPPVASFFFDITFLTVEFTDSSSDDGFVDTWLWDFGDGATSTEQNPTHVYESAGEYVVVLTVTDNEALSSSTTQQLSVENLPVEIPPVAAFEFLIDAKEVTFTDQSTDSDGVIISWEWLFGDGATAEEQHPVYTFAAAGTYVVELTVTDDSGLTDVIDKTITINDDVVDDGAFVEEGGQVVMEAEHHTIQFSNPETLDVWTQTVYDAEQPSVLAMQALEDDGDFILGDYKSDNAEMQFPLLLSSTGTYYVWLRALAIADGKTVYAGCDNQAMRMGVSSIEELGEWVWYGMKNEGRRAQFNVSQIGEKTFTIWMREDGFSVDRIVLTTDKDYIPTGVGPDESDRVSSSVISSRNKHWRNIPDIQFEEALPAQIKFYEAYPNPAFSVVNLPVDLPEEGIVSGGIYDMLGRQVRHIEKKAISAGSHRRIVVDISRLPAGVYVYRMVVSQSDGVTEHSGKMVVTNEKR